ncbi:MAG: Flp pilus assembly complex ATPase component TadA [Sandaracinaceae bacterium]|nr:Flp pilus assembly complex ATPase component TadA [Sandaracinaceae bacterium]
MLLSIELADGTVENLSIPDSPQVVIGRDPTCHVVLPSAEVSRRHCVLDFRDGGIELTDTSANGTIVGETRVVGQRVVLSLEVPFRCGPYAIRVRAEVGAVQPAQNATYVSQAGMPQPAAVAVHMAQPAQAAVAPPMPAVTAPPPAADEPSWRHRHGTAKVTVEIRRKIHRMLLDQMDLANLDRSKMDDRVLRPKVLESLKRIVQQISQDLPQGTDKGQLIEEMRDEALGLGPLELLLADETVSEIMVVDPQTIFCERRGKIELTPLRFTDDESVRSVIERIVTPLGRRIDESTPLVDARLKDGSRVNAVIKPLTIRGSCITIRKFSKNALGIQDLIGFGAMTAQMAKFLSRTVISRKNVVISGGTGSGKTTLLNVLSAAIPHEERVVTIEDAAELRLSQPHVVSLESRPANMEGKGEITIRDLVKNALRMRPDRIIVGECRSGEALDMLQAMNTGHDGSMTTTHANSPREALARLETLCLMSGLDLPSRAIREQIAQSVHIVLQQTRFSDGSRRVSSIAEVIGIDEDSGDLRTAEIFRFERTGTGKDGKVLGDYRATGYLPSFLDEFIKRNLVKEGDYL